MSAPLPFGPSILAWRVPVGALAFWADARGFVGPLRDPVPSAAVALPAVPSHLNAGHGAGLFHRRAWTV